jgi:hypothetical protein
MKTSCLCVVGSVVMALGLAGCGSSSPSHDDAGAKDAAHDVTQDSHADGHVAPHDAGVDARHDAIADAAAEASKVGLTCGRLLTCDQNCSTSACTNACYASATGVAQGLFNAFNDCLSAACSSEPGGPCADAGSTTCSNCNTSAATGACISGLSPCLGDMSVGPPDPDGGALVTVTNDGGAKLNCGKLVECQAACKPDAGACDMSCTDQATPEARALAGSLNGCLAMACPAVDGGPCQTQGPACSGCVEQVELAMPDTCAAPYIACNADTSNLPDGGTGPTPLIDGGVLTTLVSGIDQAASSLVASNGYLYYAEVLTGTPVLKLKLGEDGGVPTPLGPPQPTPVGLAVDANNVYVWSAGTFALNSSINNKDGAVIQVPLDGSAAITLRQNIELLYDDVYTDSVTVDSKNVYWVEGASGDDGVIMRTAIGSASPTAIFTKQYVPQAITTDGTNVYWADWGPLNATGDPGDQGTIWQGSVNGGTPIMLAGNLSAPEAIAVDAHNVYWTNLGPLGVDNLPAPNGGSVMRVPIGGGTITTIATAQAAPVAILVSGSTVYWSQYGITAPGLIMSAPVAGGTVTPIAAGLNDPAAIAIWGNTLYWTNEISSPTSGSISALTPF